MLVGGRVGIFTLHLSGAASILGAINFITFSTTMFLRFLADGRRTCDVVSLFFFELSLSLF